MNESSSVSTLLDPCSEALWIIIVLPISWHIYVIYCPVLLWNSLTFVSQYFVILLIIIFILMIAFLILGWFLPNPFGIMHLLLCISVTWDSITYLTLQNFSYHLELIVHLINMRCNFHLGTYFDPWWLNCICQGACIFLTSVPVQLLHRNFGRCPFVLPIP